MRHYLPMMSPYDPDDDVSPLDWLGPDNLADLDLDADTIARLLHLTGGAPVHCDQIADLLWQVRRDDADREAWWSDPHLTAADHEAARRALRRWARPAGPPGLGGQLGGAAPAERGERRAQS
jgi:hypothetical protein